MPRGAVGGSAVLAIALASCSRPTSAPVGDRSSEVNAPSGALAPRAAKRVPPSDPSVQPCGDGRIARRKLGLVSVPLRGDPLVVHELALLDGLRLSGAAVMLGTSSAIVLGGYGDLFVVGEDGPGSVQRVAVGPEDVVSQLRLAALDREPGDELLVLVERSEVFGDSVTSLPYLLVFARASGGWTLRTTLRLQIDSSAWDALQVADVTGDGVADLVAIESSAPVVFVGDGVLGFTRTPAGPLLPEPVLNGQNHVLHVTDRDRDGDLDLWLLMATASDSRSWLLALDNDGHGRFSVGEPQALVGDVVRGSTPLLDLTADGHADLLLAHLDEAAEPALSLLRGRSDGSFAEPEAIHLPKGALGGQGSVPRPMTVRDARGRARVFFGPSWDARLLELRLGKRPGVPPVLETRTLELRRLVAQALSAGTRNQPPTLYGVLSLGCRPACTDECTVPCRFGHCPADPGSVGLIE